MNLPLQFTLEGGVAQLALSQGPSGNKITSEMVELAHDALDSAEKANCTLVVLRGTPHVFCTGADVNDPCGVNPERLYLLWERLLHGPFVSLSAVEGLASAGGIGFVAACNIVLATPQARFALPEMLFGLHPACVLPFLARRIGLQAASFLTFSTQPVDAETAASWGLVDVVLQNLDTGLAQYQRRLGRLDPAAIQRFKKYISGMESNVRELRDAAITENRELFASPRIQENFRRYAVEMKFPWES